MKKLFFYLLMLPLVLTACSSDDDDNSNAGSALVTFDNKQFTVGKDGGDILVNLHNAKAIPELSYLDDTSDWIEMAQSAGGSYANDRKYYFHVAANESYESDRTGRIVFVNGTQHDTITVYQTGGRPIIFMESDTLRINALGGKREAVVNSNFDFTTTLLTEDWVQLAPTDEAATRGVVKEHTVIFQIAPNTTMADRTAKVVCTDPVSKMSDTLVIFQGAPIITAGQHEHILTPEAATLNVTLNPALDITVVPVGKWLSADNKGNIKVEALPEDSIARRGLVMYMNLKNRTVEYVTVHQRRSVIISDSENKMIHRIGLISGKSYQLNVCMADSSENTFVWTSSDPTVATVSETGLVSPLAFGQAVVTATTPEGESATCVVEVKDPKDFMVFMMSGSYSLDGNGTPENIVNCSMINRSAYQIRVNRVIINEGKKGSVTRTVNANLAVGDTTSVNATLDDLHPTFKWIFTISGTQYNVIATEQNSAIDKAARRKE